MVEVSSLNRRQLESIAEAAITLYKSGIIIGEAREMVSFEVVLDAAGLLRERN